MVHVAWVCRWYHEWDAGCGSPRALGYWSTESRAQEWGLTRNAWLLPCNVCAHLAAAGTRACARSPRTTIATVRAFRLPAQAEFLPHVCKQWARCTNPAGVPLTGIGALRPAAASCRAHLTRSGEGAREVVARLYHHTASTAAACEPHKWW